MKNKKKEDWQPTPYSTTFKSLAQDGSLLIAHVRPPSEPSELFPEPLPPYICLKKSHQPVKSKKDFLC